MKNNKISKIENELISIIIPVYNVEKYLNRCLISVVNQTYNNLQIIIVDDGSTDNSGTMCDDWAKKDKRIEVVHQENGGLSAARNNGLAKAKGKYVFFVDSDDWISLNMIEKMNAAMLTNNADMVICQYISAYPNGYMNRRKPIYGTQILNTEEALKLLLEDRQISNHVWRKMYKLSLFDNNLFPINQNFEDIYIMSSLFINCKKIVYLDEAYYYYFQNEKGIVKSVNYKNCRDYYFATKHSRQIILEKYPNLKQEIDLATWGNNLIILNDLKKIELTSQVKEFRKLLIMDCKKLPKNLSLDLEDKLLYFIIRLCPSLYNCFYIIIKIIRKFLKKIKAAFKNVKIWINIIKIKDPKFYIIGAPKYGNLGDRALLIGEHLFIKDNFSNYIVVDLSFDNLSMWLFNLIKLIIRKKDYVSIQAGGNIGTLYPSIHKLQEIVINMLHNNRVLIFPQTFYYSEDEIGKSVLKVTKKVYRRCKKLIVTTREKESYDFVRKNFPNTKSLLLPDIALNLPKYESNYERSGVLLCLRNDSEQTILESNYEKLLNVLNKKFNHIEQTDTHLYYDKVSDLEAKEQIEKLWDKMAKSQLVVTDRLHGMIFAAITQTPCAVILSKSHKIKGCYEWIKDLGYISLVENIEELSNTIDKLLKIKNPTYDNQQIKEKYQKLVEELKLWM